MNNIIIRKETKEDYHATELMTMRAFWNLHGPGCNEHLLLHKLRESNDYLPELSRVAELDGKIVGAIAYSRATIQTEHKTHDIITFGPLSVEPTAQHLGIGGMLLKETIVLAKKAGYPGICIFGEPDYYPKHGFVTCDQFGITDWNGNNFDAFLCYELQENGFAGMQGRFRESEVFETCENETELDAFNQHFPTYNKLTLSCQWLHKERLGRICGVQKNSYQIQFWELILPAKLKGNFYNGGKEFPVVGDYVTFDYYPGSDSVIREVCERKSVLKRPYPKDHSVKNASEQVMVSNVDYTFIVCSLNENYNKNRIARYVTMALNGNTIPVVILTKADLCKNPAPFEAEVRALSDQIQVHVISVLENFGLDELCEYLQPGNTIALLGSSGVGKSTLVNSLVGSEIMKTGLIRESDGKGCHTTTSRQMITLDSGVTIIDTPGMRELGMADVKEGIEDTFSDIEDLICQCRFRNCAHRTEPGCAIKQALTDKRLSEDRWQLYQSLTNENQLNEVDWKNISKKRKQLKNKH